MSFLSMEYYKKFKCIGNQCEDHCCKGWTIAIDKKTFKNYKQLKKTEFSSKLKSSIERNKDAISNNSYGFFKLVNGSCPMLSEDRLCEIYQNIGEDNMCNTCTVYPRSYNKVNDRTEGSLMLSCIEVARNILLSKECIEFSLDDTKVSDSGINKRIDKNNGNSYVDKNFDEIRSFCIGLIQERKYSIEERLSILGLFIQKLSNIEDSSLVINLINDYQYIINSDVYNGKLDNFDIESMIDAQIKFCVSVYNVILAKGINDKRFIDKFKVSFEYLKLNDTNIEDIKCTLKKSLENEYSEFINEYKYIYENYLVSYMFKSLFPVSNMSLNDTYNDLVIRFALIKMTLIGLCGHYKDDMKVDYAVEFIQSFVKVVEHDASIVQKINDYLRDNNRNSLAHMMIMMGK